MTSVKNIELEQTKSMLYLPATVCGVIFVLHYGLFNMFALSKHAFTCFCFSHLGRGLEQVQMDPGHTFLFLCYFFVLHLPCPFCGCLRMGALLLA